MTDMPQMGIRKQEAVLWMLQAGGGQRTEVVEGTEVLTRLQATLLNASGPGWMATPGPVPLP